MEYPLISSRENPLIKEYVKLRDAKKFRSERKLFVLEGARLCCDAAREGVKLINIFVTVSAMEKYPDYAEEISHNCDNVCIVTEQLSAHMSDTKSSQGIFCVAAAASLDKNLSADKIRSGSSFAVLNSLQDPGNVGTIIRAADAMGVDGVFLCGCCDVYNPKVIRSTMGSIFRVPFCVDLSFEETAKLLKSCGATLYAAVVNKDAESVRYADFSGISAVVIGNEGAGLSESDANLCDRRITIDMIGRTESLNAATAASIFLWEMTKPKGDRL